MPTFSTINHALQFGNSAPTVTIAGSDFDGYITYDMSPSGSFYQFEPNAKYFALEVIFNGRFALTPGVLINPANSNTASVATASTAIEFFVDQADVTNSSFKISAISSSNPLLGPQVLMWSFQTSGSQLGGDGYGTVYEVNTTSRLTGGPITTIGTLDLATSGVTPDTKNGITFDAYGRITATPTDHLNVDGYTIDVSDGASLNQVLQYNGTSFIAGTVTGGSSPSSWKDPILTVALSNIDISSAPAIISDVTIADHPNHRIALAIQDILTENGIYDWNGEGQPLTRSSDFDDGSKIQQNDAFFILQLPPMPALDGQIIVVANEGPFIIGTSVIEFNPYSPPGGGGGVTDNSVYTNAIQNQAVTQTKIGNQAVGSNQIANGAVGPGQTTNSNGPFVIDISGTAAHATQAGTIADGAVNSTAKFNGKVVDNTVIADNTVGLNQISSSIAGVALSRNFGTNALDVLAGAGIDLSNNDVRVLPKPIGGGLQVDGSGVSIRLNNVAGNALTTATDGNGYEGLRLQFPTWHVLQEDAYGLFLQFEDPFFIYHAHGGSLGINLGPGLKIDSGALTTTAPLGTATLVAGTVTVNNVPVSSTTVISVTYIDISGTPGFLSVPVGSRSIGQSAHFVIQSTSALDTSTVGWRIDNY